MIRTHASCAPQHAGPPAPLCAGHFLRHQNSELAERWKALGSLAGRRNLNGAAYSDLLIRHLIRATSVTAATCLGPGRYFKYGV